MPFFFFYWHIVFLCRLVFRKYVQCPHVPVSLLHFCVMVLFVNNVQRCLNGVTNVSTVTLDDSGSFSQPSLSCEKQLSLYI